MDKVSKNLLFVRTFDINLIVKAMNDNEKLAVIASRLEKFFDTGTTVRVQEMIFVAGLQVVGTRRGSLSQTDKMDVMHCGMCAILEKKGYYRLVSRREDGYPVYEQTREINMEKEARGELLRDAIISYYEDLLKD
jgi:hypothetical protein